MILKSSRIPTDAQSFPLPVPSPGYRVSGKEVEVHGSDSWHHQLCGYCNLQLIQNHVAPSHGPPARVLSPLFFSAKSLLLPKMHGKKKHSKTTWSSAFPLRTAWSSFFPYSLHQNRMDLYISTCFRTSWFFFLGLLRLGFNPSAHLPLQPHFRLLLQSVTPASIPVFFQLYWDAIVSPGRCNPMAWSQSSPSSHAGPATRRSCFPVPSWVEVTPIPLAQSMATAI